MLFEQLSSSLFILYLIFSSLVYGSLFAELIDPNAQQVYEPEAAVDALLCGIGTPQRDQANDVDTKRSR